MVRLNPVDSELSSDDTNDVGAHAQVMDDLMASYRANNKNPTSSLDYKSSEGGDQVLPPPKMMASNSKLDYEELAGMSQEEVIRKLQEYPELARELAQAQAKKAAAGNQQQQKQQQQSTMFSGKQSPRLTKLQEKGVPVTQWAILLVLMAYGAWKLYEVVAGTKRGRTKKAPVTRTAIVKNKTPAAKKKAKTSAQTTTKPTKDAPARTSAPLSSKSESATKHSKHVTIKAPLTETASKDASAKKKKNKPKSKSKDDSNASTTVSSMSTGSVQSHTDDDSVDDGWQTVGNNGVSKASKSEKEPTKPAENGAVNNGSAVATPSAATAVEDGNFVPAKAAKKKKKKNKSSKSDDETTATKATRIPNTDSDAALAARLQAAENRLDASADDDEWAEVPSKPKKKEKQSQEAVE
jgi:hypothetical protein